MGTRIAFLKATLRAAAASALFSLGWARPAVGDEKLPELPDLIPESVPPSAPRGSRAYRFVDATTVMNGTLKSISVVNGRLTYEIATVSRGEKFTIRLQNKSKPIESHVTIAPNGYVDPALLQQ